MIKQLLDAKTLLPKRLTKPLNFFSMLSFTPSGRVLQQLTNTCPKDLPAGGKYFYNWKP